MKKVNTTNGKLRYKTAGAAGVDLPIKTGGQLLPLETAIYNSGVKMAIPSGYCGRVLARSSARKVGLVIDGVIDSDYRGEIKIGITNCSNSTIEIKDGACYAQLLFMPVVVAVLNEVAELDKTDRGENGFGSTDIN